MEQKISVVIPAYNVENYIERCVESIIHQTYKNLEIILVDDGSTDSTGKICDMLKIQDSRIKVVHKKNGGLSDARNYGIRIATGKYLSFIDGDDYIEDNTYETMIKYFDRNVSIVAGGMYYHEMGDSCYISSMCREVSEFNSKQALVDLLDVSNSQLGCSACNKLYDRKLFEDISFKKGITSEDIQLLYRLYSKCYIITGIDFPFYHYVKRENSITTSQFSYGNFDILYTVQEIKNYIAKEYPDLFENVNLYELMWLLSVYKKLYYSDPFKEKRLYQQKIKEEIVRNIKGYCKKIFFVKKYWNLSFTAKAVQYNCYKLLRTVLGK